MKVTAKLRNLRIAPRKVRLLADLVRGKRVEDAVTQLSFQTKRAARPMRKLIESAMANAEHNFKLDKNNLVVSEVMVNDAITMKRSMPKAFGRANVIRKRGSHITVSVSPAVESVVEVAPVKSEAPKKSVKKTPTRKKSVVAKASADAVVNEAN